MGEASAFGRTDLTREVSLMRRLDHTHVCRFYETYEDSEIMYFVFELCEGGKLFERLENDIVLEEPEASRLGKEMASAIAHLHDKAVIHRDLKPENWLLSDMHPHSQVKLVNFGLAESCSRAQELAQPCGTLH